MHGTLKLLHVSHDSISFQFLFETLILFLYVMWTFINFLPRSLNCGIYFSQSIFELLLNRFLDYGFSNACFEMQSQYIKYALLST